MLNNERRSFVRIDDYLVFDYEIITPEEYEKQKDSLLKSPSAVEQIRFKYPFLPLTFTGESRTEFELEPHRPEQVLLGLLVNLNEKMDIILHLLGHAEKGKATLCLKPPTCVNIGGAGMRFITQEPIKQGDYLRIDILLPLFPSFIITVLGEVKRVNRTIRKEYEVAVAFKDIHEEDREALIHYIFMRQRKLIRMEKEDKDEQPID